MKMNWWHNEPIYMEDMLISSLCWNLTIGPVFIPHATATLSTKCLKERKDRKKQQQQTPPHMPNWQHQLGLFGGIPMTIFYCCQSDCAAQPLTMRKNKSRSAGSKYKCQVTDLSQEVNRQKESFKRKTFRAGVWSESHGGCGYTCIGRSASAYLGLVPAVHKSFPPSSPSLCWHHCLYSCVVNTVRYQWKMTHQKWISSPSDLLQRLTTSLAGIEEVMVWEGDCAAEDRRSFWRKPYWGHIPGLGKECMAVPGAHSSLPDSMHLLLEVVLLVLFGVFFRFWHINQHPVPRAWNLVS